MALPPLPAMAFDVVRAEVLVEADGREQLPYRHQDRVLASQGTVDNLRTGTRRRGGAKLRSAAHDVALVGQRIAGALGGSSTFVRPFPVVVGGRRR